MKERKLNRILHLVMVFAFIVGAAALALPRSVEAQSRNERVYLPLVLNQKSTLPKVTGIIGAGYWKNPADVQNKLLAADAWAGKKHTIAAFFIDITDVNPNDNFRGQLEGLWTNGYVPFVKLNQASGYKMYDIASGKLDDFLRADAKLYAAWVAQGGGRKAFIGPLPEMNGYWTVYGQDPANFKIAFSRIRSIFESELAARKLPVSSIWWTFIPNGWAEAGHEFERYYPGDALVDVVGFSSYNFGYCPNISPDKQKWKTAQTIYEPYVARMRAMAPSKPVLITQTGTVAYSANGFDRASKDQWLKETYDYIASREGVLGILYYDFNLSSWECDWTVFNTPSNIAKFDGYRQGVANPAFQYITPNAFSKLNLVP